MDEREDIKEVIEGSTEEIKQETEEIKESVGDQVEAVKEEIRKEVEEVKEEIKAEIQEAKQEIKKEIKQDTKPKEKFSIKKFYDQQYKKLLIIPFLMLVFAIIVIGVQTARTGDYIIKDVTLKGGVTLTVPIEEVNLDELTEGIKQDFPEKDILIRYLNLAEDQKTIAITADIDGTNLEEFNSFKASVENNIGKELLEGGYTVEVIGSSLGSSFFKETIRAVLIAFLFMGIVVFLYFRTFVPSMAVILAAASDIIVTLAIVDLMGIRIGTAGIAAFLMLIGYSVDTDILLSTKLLKRKEGSVYDRTLGALQTGLTMTLTTMAAALVALMLSQSDIISQIMTIILIGLAVDLINTWIQNVGILRLYLEKKHGKN
ncbi:MAG: protein translocase subunit SecF [Nanoarchaeota archaeon]|nr:protein translocase subunit SecF [Nanoarchaeota archaeon]MBU1704762.1 protein translocase subunit SecF [Nanoarchaeota archaeon]